ncbi:M14 family zinc carboxypeptidase [Spirosoma validum]|uniref:carboxypeptidase T n=1 Tax=Spirosoma validum TaxID=2771355 RepID=A0A927AX61_9BACT|nr:M14 family zinc carboxypeptidase [Spirosoma validum]MBD2751395.1 T9SS type A sorting domain-containing protein [Spirosoma validum]
MKKLYSLVWLVSLLIGSTVCMAQRIKYHRVHVQIDPLQLEKLLNNGLDVDHFAYENKKDFTGEVSDADVALFKRNGIKVDFLVTDLEKNYQQLNQQLDREYAQKAAKGRVAAVTTPANFSLGSSSYGGYYTFADIPVILDKMRALYPNLISVRTSIGSSLEGRPMYMVRISDNPDVDENEPELLLNALHHAREPIGLTQLIFFMWHVLENYNTDKEIRTLLNSSEMYIVPCVNPDGYVYNQTTTPSSGGMWRKNRRVNSGGSYGVDLNRNYGYKWGYDNSGSSPTASSDTYRGTAAFSEPEIATMRNFMIQHQFVTALNFHAYQNAVLYPNDYESPNTNPELPFFQSVATYLTAENGFTIGNSQQTLNYKINGGSNDWQWGEVVAKNKIYGFLPEIGSTSDGFWPASSRILPLCNSMIELDRKMLRISTNYGRATPTGSTVVRPTSTVVRYRFQNFGIKPASLTLTAVPLSSYVTSVGPPKTYTGLSLLQTVPDSISFTVDSNTPSGTPLAFELAVNNGMSIIKDTVTLNYTTECPAPTGLSFSNAQSNRVTLNWNAVSGSSSYAVSFKPQSSSTWPNDTFVSGTSYTTPATLNSATVYDWRVKPSCGTTYATSSFTTIAQNCFKEVSGRVTFEAESYQTSTAGTGAAANRSWSVFTDSNASAGKAMTITGTDVNVQNSLVGPRLDYALNFTTTGTYYVWVRMAAGADGIYDDSFHIGLDGGTPVTLNPNSTNYNNGSQSWSWVKAAGSTAFTVVINTPGAHTLNLWMREDGVRVDKIVMTNSASYTPTGTGPTVSVACGSTVAGGGRLGDSDVQDALQATAYPNPFDHSFVVKVNPADTQTNLRLIGNNGQMHQQAVMPVNETERTLQTGTLPAGAYYIEIIRGNERKVIPLRKQ